MCAIFGAIAKKPDPKLINKVIIGLSRLQHRGEESAGILYSNSKQVWHHKKYGLVSQVFDPVKIQEINKRQPTMIIGQTHYSTSGNKSERNIPPQFLNPGKGKIGVVHNGNIHNLDQKKKSLEQRSLEEVEFDEDNFEIMNDSEFMINMIVWLMGKSNFDAFESIKKFIQEIPGSYSAALLSRKGVHVFRDSYKNRPLHWVENDEGISFASETCALDNLGGNITELMPGEIMEILPDGKIGRTAIVNNRPTGECPAECVFENIYFSKPSSMTQGRTEYDFRFELGRRLARLAPVTDADFITYIPDSGRPVAEGFAYESGKPLISIYERDYYVGRTFIFPDPETRKHLAKIKLTLIKGLAKNKKVVLLDDTVVRGTVIGERVAEIRADGALEVHVRISAPPIISPCYYGIDMKTKEELIAANLSVEEIRKQKNATSFFYLPLEELQANVNSGGLSSNKCYACFTGNYPIPLD